MNQSDNTIRLASLLGLTLFAGILIGRVSVSEEITILKSNPTVVMAFYNKHQLVFRAAATNSHLFYLSSPTNGTFMKTDFYWSIGSSPSNLLDKVEHNQL